MRENFSTPNVGTFTHAPLWPRARVHKLRAFFTDKWSVSAVINAYGRPALFTDGKGETASVKNQCHFRFHLFFSFSFSFPAIFLVFLIFSL